jgi:hypothetical protein
MLRKADGSFDRLEVQHHSLALPNTANTAYTVLSTPVPGARRRLALATAFSAPASEGKDCVFPFGNVTL